MTSIPRPSGPSGPTSSSSPMAQKHHHLHTATPLSPRHARGSTTPHRRLPPFAILILTTLTLLLLFPARVSAVKVPEADGIQIDVRDAPIEAQRLSGRGELLIDRRPSPLAPRASLFPKRDATASATVTAEESASTNSASDASSTDASAIPLATASSTDSAGVTVPTAFDSSLGNNFTASSCPSFFDTFLSNQTFIDCVPMSMYLRNSQSFFDLASSATKLSLLLDASCAVEEDTCGDLMSFFADEITLDSNCGADFELGNPLVTQAYDSFLAYTPLYSATCLKAAETGAYCFADAYTNTSNVADSYPYYLPIGISLPASVRPSCTNCLKNTMQVFAAFAVDTEQPLSQTYESAAEQINMGCGVNFVNETVAVGTVTSSAAYSTKASWTSLYVPLTLSASTLLLSLLF